MPFGNGRLRLGTTLGGLAVALVLAGASCGDDDTTEAAASSTTPSTTTTTAETTTSAAEDGEEASNDYHVRNDDPGLRDVPVADGTTVVSYRAFEPTDFHTVSYDEWRTAREARDHQLAVWLEVEDRTITSIEEQWVP